MAVKGSQRAVILVVVAFSGLLGAAALGYFFSGGLEEGSIRSSTKINNDQLAGSYLQADPNLDLAGELEQAVRELSVAVQTLAQNQALLEEKVDLLIDPSALEQTELTTKELTVKEREALFEQERNDTRTAYEQLITANSDATEVWSAEQERRFETLLLEDPVVSKVQNGNIECSNGLCRLEYEIPKDMDLLERDLFDMSLAMQLGSGVASSTQYKDDIGEGEVKYTYYLRQGSPLVQGEDGLSEDDN